MSINQIRTRPARVVLAEDDPAIARLIGIALKRTGIPHDLEIVHDGDGTIAALETPSTVGHLSPTLLLLDINMPGKNGFDVLEYVKRHPQLRRIPVVIFSNSDRPADVNRAYDLHANAYVRKNTEFADLCHTMDTILRFWLQTSICF
jgi:CheY-like chemotaxis protein